MSSNPVTLNAPATDPTPIFEAFRGFASTELLTAAVAEFDLFGRIARCGGALGFDELRAELGLERRPTLVLTIVLRALGLLADDDQGQIALTPLAREHLIPGADFDVSGYVGLAAGSPGVRAMVERLRTNRPFGAGADSDAGSGSMSTDPSVGGDPEGAAFIYREGLDSAMEQAAAARRLTMALAGRARNVAPALAEALPLDGATRLLDVGAGTGLYSFASLQKAPGLRATLWDRPEVLKVARELAVDHVPADRITFLEGDMFADPVPDGCDRILLSNILHDWDEPECQLLVDRLAEALPSGGQLLIHDVFLNDALDGPLPIALYGAHLFELTEGRAYSAGEYSAMLKKAGLNPGPITPTLVHCGVLPGIKA